MEVNFNKETLTSEDGFWTMFYFLKEHYDLAGGEFDLSDILSACEPMDWSGSGEKIPADSSMIEYWNEALEKYRKQGKPIFKQLKK